MSRKFLKKIKIVYLQMLKLRLWLTNWTSIKMLWLNLENGSLFISQKLNLLLHHWIMNGPKSNTQNVEVICPHSLMKLLENKVCKQLMLKLNYNSFSMESVNKTGFRIQQQLFNALMLILKQKLLHLFQKYFKKFQ